MSQNGQALQRREPNGQELTFKQKVQTMRDLLEKQKEQIRMALPRHMSPDRLARIALTTITQNPKLLECYQPTLIRCILQAAQLGLEPDGLLGQAYLVPFWNGRERRTDCQLIPGYKGLLKLARQSNEIAKIEAHAVRIGDTFSYDFGSGGHLKHRPAEPPVIEVSEGKDKVLTPDPSWRPGRITHFYAFARLRDGTEQFDVMPTWEVNEIRDKSQGYKTAVEKGWDNPWISHYPEMGKKTVLRRICKMLPASIELQGMLANDDRADAGLPQDFGDVIDLEASAVNEVDEAKPATKLDKLAAKVDEKRAEPADAPEPGSDG